MVFPEFDPVLFSIGPLPIRWYALAYVAGILVGWRYAVGLVRDSKLWGGKPATATPAAATGLGSYGAGSGGAFTSAGGAGGSGGGGMQAGSAVTLRARQVDGRNVYERASVVLSGTFEWRVP